MECVLLYLLYLIISECNMRSCYLQILEKKIIHESPSTERRKLKWIFNPRLEQKKNSISLVVSRNNKHLQFHEKFKREKKSLNRQKSNPQHNQNELRSVHIYIRSSTKSPKLQAAKKVNCHFSRLFLLLLLMVFRHQKKKNLPENMNSYGKYKANYVYEHWKKGENDGNI